MNELALFAGAGGGILGGHLLGWKTVCAVEIEPYPASVLVQRQNDGILPPFPVWDDIRTFDGRPWRGLVDVVSGGFPCQDISSAGKGAGITGERSGLWSEMARIIREVRPSYAYVENSPMLTVRGLGRVLGDLAQIGYDAEWGVLGAKDIGGPHHRKRIWILAKSPYASCQRCSAPKNEFKDKEHPKWNIWNKCQFNELLAFGKSRYAFLSPDERMGDGLAEGLDRLKAIGNGQVPLVAANAFIMLAQRFERREK